MSSVNKVILIGNVGKEPELKTTVNGRPYCVLNLATTESWKDKVSGQRKENTTWHRVKVYEPIASFCAKIVNKGDKVYIEGQIRNDEYERNGEKVKSTEIVCNKLNVLFSRNVKPQESVEPEVDHSKTAAFDFIMDEIPF